MAERITAMEARKKFGEVLNRVSLLKEEFIIERAGKKIARLSPAEEPEQPKGGQGKLDFRKAAGLGREIWQGLDVEQYLREEREAWD